MKSATPRMASTGPALFRHCSRSHSEPGRTGVRKVSVSPSFYRRQATRITRHWTTRCFFRFRAHPATTSTTRCRMPSTTISAIQRQLSESTVMTLGYVGTQGHKLIAQRESNPGDPALCLSLRGSGVLAGTPQCGPGGELGVYTRPDGSTVNGTRGPLGPDFGSNSYTFEYREFQLQCVARPRWSGEPAILTFLAAYTYSKAIDNSSAYGQFVNFMNYRKSRALSSFDLTHNFVVSYNYELPFRRAFSGAPRRLTEGWSVNGITRFASGFPVTITQSGDRSLTGTSGVDEPDFIGGLVFQRSP